MGVLLNTLSMLGTYSRNDFVVSSDSTAFASLGPISEKCSLKASEIDASSICVFWPISNVFVWLLLELLPQTLFIVLHSFLGLSLLTMQASL